MKNILEELPNNVNITISKSELMEFAQFLISEALRNSVSPQKSILNIEEVAELCQISKRTVYKKTSLGEIPHYKQSGKLFFKRDELDSWLTEKKGFYKPDISAVVSTYNMMKQFRK
jgi:excisionase family DNA binding protein